MNVNRERRIEEKKKQLLALAKAYKNTRDGKKAKEKKGKKTPGSTASAALPLSGSEKEYTDLVWGSPEGVTGNNCYGYALGVYRDGGYDKLQPGELAKTSKPGDDLTDCATLRKRTLEDLGKSGYVVDPKKACTAGYYKIMGFVDKGKDFHWYRQNGSMLVRANGKQTVSEIATNAGVSKNAVRSGSNRPGKCETVLLEHAGLWSHKRGLEELTVKDAVGKFIVDPRKANRNYGSLKYSTFCNAFCVKKDFGEKFSRP